MRVLRRIFDREKLFQAFSKLLLVAFSVLICLWMISGARAASNNLKDIKLIDAKSDSDARIELSFQNELNADEIKVEYQRNFAQISIPSAQIHPARTKSAKKGQLDKVFAYQFQPDLARARLMFKGDLKKIEANASMKVEGKKIIFTFKADQTNPEQIVDSKNEQKVEKLAQDTAKKEISDELKTSVSALDREEEKSAQEILSRTKSTAFSAATAEKRSAKQDELLFQNHKKESQEPIVSAESKPVSPAKRILAGLFTVLLIMGSVALAFRRFVLKKSANSSASDNLIETISTQMLGPKRSISVIRVAKQYLVVSMSGDSIQLLCQLNADSGIEKFIGAESSGFDSILEKNLSNDSSASTDSAIANKASLRDSIRRRMESFKPLSRA